MKYIQLLENQEESHVIGAKKMMEISNVVDVFRTVGLENRCLGKRHRTAKNCQLESNN